MVRKTKEEALETRRRILEAATAVFDRRNWKDVTLEDVASAAGVTRGAVYWHFADKEYLFNAVCQATPLPAELIDACVEEWCGDDPLGHFRQACLEMLAEVSALDGAAEVFAAPSNREELLDPAGSLLLRHRTSVQRSRNSLQQVLRAAADKGQLPASLDTELSARLLHGIVAGLLGDCLLNPGSFGLAAQGERAINAASACSSRLLEGCSLLALNMSEWKLDQQRMRN